MLNKSGIWRSGMGLNTKIQPDSGNRCSVK